MAERNIDWNKRYAEGDTPWDSGQPSQELERVLKEYSISASRALEIGCGTGTNAVFLAQRGFDVTAVELVPQALGEARHKARQAGVVVRFVEADLLSLPEIGPPFPFVFDRGVYHVLRQVDVQRFSNVIAAMVQPRGLYLTLAGNANESNPPEGGPPRVHAHELCLELGPFFEIVQLREFRFDGVRIQGQELQPLAWSALLRRKQS